MGSTDLFAADFLRHGTLIVGFGRVPGIDHEQDFKRTVHSGKLAGARVCEGCVKPHGPLFPFSRIEVHDQIAARPVGHVIQGWNDGGITLCIRRLRKKA